MLKLAGVLSCPLLEEQPFGCVVVLVVLCLILVYRSEPSVNHGQTGAGLKKIRALIINEPEHSAPEDAAVLHLVDGLVGARGLYVVDPVLIIHGGFICCLQGSYVLGVI